MGVLDSIFGSKKKTNSSGLEQVRGSQGISSTSTAKSSMDQFSELMERIAGSTSSTVTKGGEQSPLLLDSIIKVLEDGFIGDQREAGRQAAKQASASAVKNVMALGLPDIRTGATMTGGYDSTTRQLMTDNLAAQAAREGAQVELGAMVDFSNQQLEAVSQALKAVLQMQEGNIVTEVEDTQTREGSENSTAVEDNINRTDQLTSTEVDTAQSGTVTSRGRDSLFDNAVKAYNTFM